jgi:hypothetical protein
MPRRPSSEELTFYRDECGSPAFAVLSYAILQLADRLLKELRAVLSSQHLEIVAFHQTRNQKLIVIAPLRRTTAEYRIYRRQR